MEGEASNPKLIPLAPVSLGRGMSLCQWISRFGWSNIRRCPYFYHLWVSNSRSSFFETLICSLAMGRKMHQSLVACILQPAHFDVQECFQWCQLPSQYPEDDLFHHGNKQGLQPLNLLLRFPLVGGFDHIVWECARIQRTVWCSIKNFLVLGLHVSDSKAFFWINQNICKGWDDCEWDVIGIQDWCYTKYDI